MKQTISLVMIVRDVEKTLDRCLESFGQCADEIIVVDTGSLDNSVKIAEKYTDKIFHFKWIDDFSAARNYSFDQCTKEFIHWCCHPDTLVHTENGLFPISEISVGDKVLTHKGVYKPVVKTYIQNYEGKVYKFKSKFSDKDIIVTPNHEFFSTKKVQCKTGVKFCAPNCRKQWSKRKLKTSDKDTQQCKQLYNEYKFGFNSIKSLETGDVIAYPRNKQTIFEPFFVEMGDGFKCKHKIPKQIELTLEFMRLIGYYVAEGSYGKGSCLFHFHKDEIKYHDDVLYLMKKIFNMEGTKFFNGGNRCSVTFCSTTMAKFFYETLNKLQPTRSLPNEWLCLSNEHLAQFLKGYYRGDGDDNSDSFRMTTTSPKLVYQIREILSRFGIFAHITPYKTTANGAWKISIGGDKKQNFEFITSEKHSTQPPYLNRNKFYYSDDDCIYSPISSLDTESYVGKVYNLEVEDDHTYVTDYSLSHNCDGDDYILPEDIKRIQELDLTDWDMVVMDYIYAQDEFGNDKSVVPRERIIRRSMGLKWQEPIHECLILQGRIKRIDIRTYHHKQYGTSERNLAILERITQKEPSSRNLFYLGKEYYDLGKSDLAIEPLSKFIKIPGAFWGNVYQAHCKLAMIYLQKKDEGKFKEHIFESIRMEDRQAEPIYFLALFYMNKGQWGRAIQWFEICAHLDHPKDLLSSYFPEYFTWLPNLNLCFCYNAIGETQKAYDSNEKVMKYRPKDPRAIRNKKILKNALKKKSEKMDGKGKKLNLGSGGNSIEGFVSVDLFKSPKIDEVFDMGDIPYLDNTIGAIYSEHSLEHVSFERVEEVLKEWCRVLKPGGELILYMPDFENCCREYLKAPLEHPHFTKTRAWFKYTVYGIQKSQGGEPDEAQFHLSGFSKEEIHLVVEQNGFIVDKIENYGGEGQKPSYGTPSMGIRARKREVKSVEKKPVIVKKSEPVLKSEPVPKEDLGIKVGWIGVENWVAAQTRIRVLKVNEWLKDHGVETIITNNCSDIITQNFDIAIIGKRFDEEIYNGVKELKTHGKLVYIDLCEDIINWSFVNEITELCDKVICCSNVLAEKVKPINPNVVVIEDAYETV